MSNNNCPLCGSNKTEIDFVCNSNIYADELFDIYRCGDCGFQFTQKIIETSNEANHKVATLENKGFIGKIYNFAHGIMLQKKVALIKKLTMLHKGKILDYGAKDCDFANIMANRKWETTIVSSKECACKEQKFDRVIKQIDEEKFTALQHKYFDVITAWHVIEHINDFDIFMSTSYNLLDENGILILATPNTASYDAENYNKDWVAFNVPYHLWHFNSSTMMQLGKKHGFILERRYPMPFDGFYISIMSEKKKGTRIPIIKGLWNGFLGWIASFDKCSASSSIIYVFRKK